MMEERGGLIVIAAARHGRRAGGSPGGAGKVRRQARASIRERLRIYARETEPVIDYYTKRGLITVLDGHYSPDVVSQSIEAAGGAREIANSFQLQLPASSYQFQLRATASTELPAGRYKMSVLMPSFSRFASTVGFETAFTVLGVAKRLIAGGKDVIELEIGDSPFSSPPKAIEAGVNAIRAGHSRYGPSLGIPEFREAAAEYVRREYGVNATAENVIAGPGAKNFEQLFCEAFLNAGDGVLVFSPHFPTYPPNIFRRDARMVLSNLKASHDFRPDLADVEKFLADDPSPRAIFINSPHNPTGGVALREDLEGLADLVRGRDVAVFSDEPYDRMVWRGRHHSLLEFPGMMEQAVAGYTFSKSFSMSGWRPRICGEQPGHHRRAGEAHQQRVVLRPSVHADGGRRGVARGARVPRREDEGIPPEGGAAGGRVEQDRRRLLSHARWHVLRVPLGGRRSATALGLRLHGLAMFLMEGADEAKGRGLPGRRGLRRRRARLPAAELRAAGPRASRRRSRSWPTRSRAPPCRRYLDTHPRVPPRITLLRQRRSDEEYEEHEEIYFSFVNFVFFRALRGLSSLVFVVYAMIWGISVP
jgi:aspartate aminotransferase